MGINLSKDKKFLKVLWQATDGLTLLSDDRTKLGAGCLQLAQDHHASILLLVEKFYYSSAFALLRIQFDSFLRGVWILKLASDKEINTYKKDRLDIGINKLITIISTLVDYKDTEFKNISKSLKTMNSYAHSGFAANLNHQDSNFIQPNHKKEDILNLIKFSNFFGILSSLEILQLSQNEITNLDAILNAIKENLNILDI